jgi:hypothetical protein
MDLKIQRPNCSSQNAIGPAQVKQMIHKLTCRKPSSGLMNLMTSDPTIKVKVEEDSTAYRNTRAPNAMLAY